MRYKLQRLQACKVKGCDAGTRHDTCHTLHIDPGAEYGTSSPNLTTVMLDCWHDMFRAASVPENPPVLRGNTRRAILFQQAHRHKGKQVSSHRLPLLV